MKKILCLFLAVWVSLGLFACSSALPGLSDGETETLKKAWFDSVDPPSGSWKDVEIEPLGRYGDAYAGLFYAGGQDYAAVITEETVDGVRFVYGDGNRIRVCREGCFYTLSEAFAQEILTGADLKAIQKAHAAGRESLYESAPPAVPGADAEDGSATAEPPQQMTKNPCKATEDDDFAEDKIVLVMQSGEECRPEDVEAYGVISVEPLVSGGETAYGLTLDRKDKKNVLAVIRRLEESSRVCGAESAYTLPVAAERIPFSWSRAEEWVNLWATGADGPYTVDRIFPLKSVSYPDGFYYYLCQLNPLGWVVITERGDLMQGNFHGGNPPELDPGRDWYYVGVDGFAYEKDGALYLPESDAPVNLQGITAVEGMTRLSDGKGWTLRFGFSYDPTRFPRWE